MRRYLTTRPRAGEVMDHDRGEAAHTATVVFEPEPNPVWICIYDATGESLVEKMRAAWRNMPYWPEVYPPDLKAQRLPEPKGGGKNIWIRNR